MSKRSTLERHTTAAAVAVAFLVAGALAGSPAGAAVTDLSCPGRTPHAHTFGDVTGEDYHDLYEQIVASSPTSRVSAGSSWTCTNFQRRDDVAELIFTSSLGPTGHVGGSSLQSVGCGQVFSTDLTTGARFDVREERAVIEYEDLVTCDWGVPTALLITGRSYRFEVSESMTYDWESLPGGASYRFRAVITVHAQVPNPSPNTRDVPVCYRTVPGAPCNGLPV